MISSLQSRPLFKVSFNVFVIVSVRVSKKSIMKSSLRSHPLSKVIRPIVNSIGIRTILSSEQSIFKRFWLEQSSQGLDGNGKPSLFQTTIF